MLFSQVIPPSPSPIESKSLFYTSVSLYVHYFDIGASLVAQLVKNPPAMQESLVQFLGWEDPLEKG